MSTENNRPFENEDELPEDFGLDENVEHMAAEDMPEDFEAQDTDHDGAYAALAAEIESLKAENADLKDRLLRAVAEADNVRKRSEKERGDTAKFAVSNFARHLVGVADNLRRAIDAVPEERRAENELIKSMMEGVEATEREMLRAFEAAGIKPIDALDQPFNPNFHEVMFEAEMPDKPAGTVFQVLETGYMIHDRLLRPARVGVTKGGPKVQDKKIDEEI